MVVVATSVSAILPELGGMAGGVVLSVMLIVTFIMREICVSLPANKPAIISALNAILLPFVFGFLAILAAETLAMIS